MKSPGTGRGGEARNAPERWARGAFARLLGWIARPRPATPDPRPASPVLQAALEGGGCPLCGLADEAVVRRLEALFHEGVTDPGVRAGLRRSLGFCRRHAQDALRRGNALGLAILYQDLAREAAERLRAPAGRRRPPPLSPCPLCAAERETETLFAAALARALTGEPARAAYRRGHGLCAAHLPAVLAAAPEAAALFLRREEGERLEALAGELALFIRRCDHSHRDEPMGAERDAWRRALEKVAGSPPGHGARTHADSSGGGSGC